LRSKPSQRSIFPKNLKGVPDLVFTALRLEFGQGNFKPKPHWRPALWTLKRAGLPKLLKDPNFAKTVCDPNFKGWMSWPKKTSKRISAKVAKSFVPFQKKLGIKF